MKLDDEYDFVRALFKVLREDETGIFNYTGMAKALETNRHMVAGAVTALVALGILSFIQKSTKSKFFQVNGKFSVRVVINRLRDLLGLQDEEPLSKADWERYMGVLVSLVLTPDQVRQYYRLLKDEGLTQFTKTLDAEYYEGDMGATLPPVARDLLSTLLYRVIYNGLAHLSAEAWQGFMRTDS